MARRYVQGRIWHLSYAVRAHEHEPSTTTPDGSIVWDTTKGRAMFEDGWAFEAMRDFGPYDAGDAVERNHATARDLLDEYELEDEYLDGDE